MRSWDSHTQSALGVRKHPAGRQSRGPSRTIRNVWRDHSNPAYGPWRLSMDARTLLAKRVPGYVTAPGYRCFVNLGGCAADPGSLAKSVADNELVSALIPWERNAGLTYEDVRAYETSDRIDLETAGLYSYDSDPTGTPVCWTRLRARDLGTGSFNIWAWFPRLPYDVLSPTRALVFRNRFTEAQLSTGDPGCASGWLGGTPPAGIRYAAEGTVGYTKHYDVWSRASEDAPWQRRYGPWQVGWSSFPAGSYEPGVSLQESTGLIWAINATPSWVGWKVWPHDTEYASATPETVSIPTGTVSWWAHWGRVTIARSTTGTIYVWDRTTSLGPVPAPFSASAWSWASMAYGWLTITEQSTRRVLWYRVNQDGTGVEHVFTQDTWPAQVGAYNSYPVDVEPCGEHDAVSGTWTRYLYDARRARWEHGGEMPHVRRHFEDDGWYWYATRYRHLVMAEDAGGFIENYHLVQVT